MSWDENVRKVVPYVPGEQPKSKDVIKLNTNECPYAPSPMVLSAIKAYDGTDLRKWRRKLPRDIDRLVYDLFDLD